jgi:hypothetical protein
MKTMLSVDGKKIVRISDEKSSKLYSEGFRFIPKSEWKEKVRDVNKPKEEKPTKNKNNEMSRATKRHLRKSNK